MKDLNPRKEIGQVIVILMVGLVALIGMAALAIDGGMVFSDRRIDQNAADTAAVAGAKRAGEYMQELGIVPDDFNNICPTTDPAAVLDPGNTMVAKVLPVVQARALSNGFTNIDSNLDDKNGAWVTCDRTNKVVVVHVQITKPVQTFLIQLVYTGPVVNTVNAAAQVFPSQPVAPDAAIIGLNETACGTVNFHGNIQVNVNGGDIYSNSDRGPDDPNTACTEQSCYSGRKDGNTSIALDGGEIYLNGDWGCKGQSGVVTPEPNEHQPRIVVPPIPEPSCAGLPSNPAVALHGNSPHAPLEPGIYSSISVSNGDLLLKPGLYCLDGDFSSNGGSVKVTKSLTDNNPADSPEQTPGVLIYLRNGSFNLTGNTDVSLFGLQRSSPLPIVGGGSFDFGGLLVYSNPNNSGEVNLFGTSQSEYSGTIYAPSSECRLGGTNDARTPGGYQVQVICDTVDIGGGATINIDWDSSKAVHIPATLDFIK